MKWYKHDPSAALAGMFGLTVEERGAYYTLIDVFYDRDGHVPDDDWFMARILGCNPRTWRRLKVALFQKQKVRVVDGNLEPNRGRSTLIEAKQFAELQRNRVRMRWERAEKPNKNNDASIPITTTSTTTSTMKKESASRSPKKARSRAKTPFPEGWEPTLDPTERTEFEKFKASALAHGRIYANWEQAWRNWKLNAPNFMPTRNVKERNRETMDDLNSFIDQCAADAGSRRPPDAQGRLLLPVSKSNGAQGVSERAGERACDILGSRGNGRDSESYGSKS